MYGIKAGNEPVIIVADREVSAVPSRWPSLMVDSGWCTMAGTGRETWSRLTLSILSARGDISGYCAPETLARVVCTRASLLAW